MTTTTDGQNMLSYEEHLKKQAVDGVITLDDGSTYTLDDSGKYVNNKGEEIQGNQVGWFSLEDMSGGGNIYSGSSRPVDGNGVALNQMAMDPFYADARTQALMEHQQAKTRNTMIGLGALQVAGVSPYLSTPGFVKTLDERTEPEFRKEETKKIDEQIAEEGQQATRQVQKGSAQIASQLERQQAAMGGITSAEQAARPQQQATKAAVEGLVKVNAYLGDKRQALLDRVDAKVEEALQGVYMYEQQRKQAIAKAATNLSMALMRVKSTEGIAADMSKLGMITKFGQGNLTSAESNELYQQLYGEKSYFQFKDPTEEDITKAYRKIKGDDAPIPPGLISSLTGAGK